MRLSELLEIIDMDTELSLDTDKERFIYDSDWDISYFEPKQLRAEVTYVSIEDGVLVIDIEM